jgi:hypothetical protein
MKTNISRRQLLLMVIASIAPWKISEAKTEKPSIDIWKSPTCGCCHDWMAHMEKNGFQFKAIHNDGNDDIRKKLGIAIQYGSCHTALIDGYALEGHVPAKEVHRLLREKPPAIGLTVPAMPIGSPGMDGPEYGGRKDQYQVLLIQKNGRTQIYQSYN